MMQFQGSTLTFLIAAFRACVGADAARQCNHIYDLMGCYWNMPANYDPGVFESCDGDVGEPMGVYGGSVWYQGVEPTPGPHGTPSSSNCHTVPTVTPSKMRRAFEKESF